MTNTLYLAHINDCHAHFDPSRLQFSLPHQAYTRQVELDCGGYALLAGALNAHRQLAANEQTKHLFLHAGDCFQGSLYFSRFRAHMSARMLNLLAPDACTIGNHEFDLGNDELSEFIGNVNFDMLAGNMDLSGENPHKTNPLGQHSNLLSYDSQLNIARYQLHQLNGKPLAVFGIVLDSMRDIGCPDNDNHFHCARTVVQATVKHLRAQGIVHIILLSHLGYEQDCSLAAQVPELSLIVGGHSHHLTEHIHELNSPRNQVEQNWQAGETLILHAGQHAESIGLHQLRFNAQGRIVARSGGLFFPIEAKALSEQAKPCPALLMTQPDAHISALLNNEYRPAIMAMNEAVLTHIRQPLHHTRLPSTDFPQGSQIAPRVCHSFYLAAKAHVPIDFAMHNAGGVRCSLEAGALTQAQVYGQLLPFQIELVAYQLQGKYLKSAIEGAISNALNLDGNSTGTGSYPYCHNLRFTYDIDAALGQRLTQLEIKRHDGWHEVEDECLYWGVSSAYTLAGKEGYTALQQHLKQHNLGLTMSDAFCQFAEQLWPQS